MDDVLEGPVIEFKDDKGNIKHVTECFLN